MNHQDDKKAFACANCILDTLENAGVENVNIFTLQKLLYLGFAIHLFVYEEKLFDEKIQAWSCGSVVPSVYRSFKNCGNFHITKNNRARIMEDFTGEITTPNLTSLDDPENAEKSLKFACLTYYNYDICKNPKAWNLFQTTHREKTSAWHKAYNNPNNKSLDDTDIVAECRLYVKEIWKLLCC